MNGELFGLMLQIIGVIVMTIAIGLLLPLATDLDDKPRAPDDRPDASFPEPVPLTRAPVWRVTMVRATT